MKNRNSPPVLPLLRLLLLLVFLSPAAHAGKFYVGAGAGSSNAELPGGTTRVDFDDTGYTGYLGYRILRPLAAELSYTDFGSPSAAVGTTQYEADLKIAALWAVGILPVSPRLELYGRLGYGSWDSTVEFRDTASSDPTQTEDADGYDLGWGVGLGYNLTPSWGFQLDWQNYDLDRADEVTFTALSVRFRF